VVKRTAFIPGRRRRSRNLQPGPLLCQTRLQSTSLYLEAECGTAYRRTAKNLRHPSAARHQTDFGSPKYRLSLRIAENRAGRRPVHTSNHRHRIRADPDAHHGQNKNDREQADKGGAGGHDQVQPGGIGHEQTANPRLLAATDTWGRARQGQKQIQTEEAGEAAWVN